MSAQRRAARLHPVLLSLAIALGATALLGVLVASLAQAHAAVTAALPAAAPAAAAPAISAPAQVPTSGEDAPVEYMPGVLLVKLKPQAAAAVAQPAALSAQGVDAAGTADAAAAAVTNLFQPYGVTSAEPLLAGDAAGAFSVLAADGSREPARGALTDVYRLHLAPQLDAGQMALALAADANVQYAEPDYIARPARVPNDPEYGSQWALAKIGAPAAWDVQTGDSAVVIAVIDSGVDTSHPEFAGRLWENDDPLNGVDDDLNGQVDDAHGWNVVASSGDLADANGHGTQVGGVLGAAADNGQGIAGLCWGCKLMFVNAMQASGVANYSDIAEAVIYASSNGAQVINLSLGGYADSALLADAIREASTTAVIVAGAGNDDSAAPFYPAAYPQVLAVAATGPNDQKAVFSNYGAWVDLSAPGLEIRTTTVGGSYATESGTSLAAAYVSGLAGLVRSEHPLWTPEQVKWQLLNTAANIDAANPGKVGQLGRGRIDAAAALATDPQARAAVESYALDGETGARPAPGQSFSLVLSVQNQWLPGQNLQGTLSSSDPNVTITDAAGGFGDIAPGQSASNAADPFGVTVGGAAPYNQVLTFTLTLSGNGGYSLALPFTVQVRSAVETLGNTQYNQDTTWTNDKTYVLNGSVIVGQGVTLTIQPGTVVKANAGKFIRIDGTLIAVGTAEQPIVLTSNAEDGTWGGIRFAISAIDAIFEDSGEYLGGSILRYVEVSKADVGLSLNSRAPYIADSRFASNGLAISIGDDPAGGRVRIERNHFAGSGIVSAGGATIAQNSFTSDQENIACGVTGDSNSLVLQNTFIGKNCGIQGIHTYVISNTVRGGSIELMLSSYGSKSAPPPPFLKDMDSVVEVATGQSATCFLLKDGSMLCSGYNRYGQLGDGTNNNSAWPQNVVGLTGKVTQMTTGQFHTCAVLESGSAQCWGQGGQLGTGNTNDANTPQNVVGLVGEVTQITSGSMHTCALLKSGSIQCWGANDMGQLGIGNDNFGPYLTPQIVVGLAGKAIQIDATSEYHTCAVLENGKVQCWGEGDRGQLGTGNTRRANTPQSVVGLAGPVTQITVGYEHTCALLASGGVQCWGRNPSGELGTGNNDGAVTPQSVIGLAGQVLQITAGYLRTCAVIEGGVVQCWGHVKSDPTTGKDTRLCMQTYSQ